MMRATIALLLIGIVSPLLAEEEEKKKKEGQLQRAREEVRPKSQRSSANPTPSPSSTTTGDDHSHHQVHDHPLPYHHNGGAWTFSTMYFGQDYDADQPKAGSDVAIGMLVYPYADDQHGWTIRQLEPPADPTKPATVRVRQIAGTLRGEYTDGGDGLSRYAGAVMLSFSGVVRLEGELQRYIEHLPDDHTDTLTVGSAGVSLAYPLANNAIVLCGGSGLSFYHDHYGNETGLYLKAGAEVFPLRPLVLSAEVWGSLVTDDEDDETSTFVGSGRAVLGVVWTHLEVYGGWQATWIESVTLDGPTAGVRLWF